MRYTWTDEKYRDNLRQHHIAFEDAVRIFEGPTVEKVDDRFDYGEIRVYAIGLVNGVEITVIYTERDHDERRIIGCIGKKGATYAACFRDLMNDWGVSRFWASADRCVAA